MQRGPGDHITQGLLLQRQKLRLLEVEMTGAQVGQATPELQDLNFTGRIKLLASP